VFSTPESGKISDRWTAVRILGGDDLDAEGAAFMRRYGLIGYPSLLAITAGGALVDRDLSGGRFRDATGLYQAMERAEESNRAFLAERERLLAAGDADSLLELAAKMEARLDLAAASALYERIVAAHPSVEAYDRWLRVLAAGQDREREQEVLDAVIAAYPDAEGRMAWRMRRATLHVEPPRNPTEEGEVRARLVRALEALREQVAAAGDVEGEAEVRVHMARLARAGGAPEEGDTHLDWIFEHAPDGRAALDARLLLAQAALRRRDADGVREQTAHVLEKAPDGLQAAVAHMMLGDLAYAASDLDGMEEHYGAVVRIAPDTEMAAMAKEAIEAVKRRRARDAGN